MKFALAFIALGQVSYESMDAGERFLYHQLTKKISELEKNLSASSLRQNEIRVGLGEMVVRIESLKDEQERQRRQIDTLNGFKDNSLGRRTAEMGGVAGGTGLIIALVNFIVNKKLATKGRRNGSRG